MVLAIFTGLALVVFRTGAVEVTRQAVAQRLVLTGVRFTGVWVRQTLHLTEHPCIVCWAFTNKAVQNNMATAAVLTRTTGTFVPRDFTV